MTVLTGFLTSFTIEFFQLTTKRGIFEVTDLVTNVSGTAIGAITAAIFIGIAAGRKQDKNNE